MAERIDFTELERMLADDLVPDAVLAPYLKPAYMRSLPLAPTLTIDETLVEAPATRGIIGLSIKSLNDRVNRRRLDLFKQRIDAGWRGPRLLAEGDSWFLYPILLRDVIEVLSKDFAIYSIAAAGDTLENMTRGAGHIEELIVTHNIDAVLLSAGGNDIAGDQLLRYLKAQPLPPKAPTNYLNTEFERFLTETRASLDRIITRLIRRRPGIKVFCHGYDWPFPRHGGHWLAPALSAREIPDAVQPQLLRHMIDRFYEMLQSLAETQRGAVHIVDCRGLVGNSDSWFDELHPLNAGFARVAERFREKIDEVLSVNRSRATREAASISWYPSEDPSNSRVRNKVVPVGAIVTLGRSPRREISIDDDRVSRKHARFEVMPGHVMVRDLDSTNGTLLDGRPIKWINWRPGQKLAIGPFTLELQIIRTEQDTLVMFPPAPAPAPTPSRPAYPPDREEAGERQTAHVVSQPRPAAPGVAVPPVIETPPTPSSGPAPGAMLGLFANPAAVQPAPTTSSGLRRLEIVLSHGSITDVRAPAYAIGVFQQVNPLSTRGSCSAINDELDGQLEAIIQGGVFGHGLGEISLLPANGTRSLSGLLAFAGLGAIGAFAPRALEVVGENLGKVLAAARIDEFVTVPMGVSAGISIKEFLIRFLTGLLRGLSEPETRGGLHKIGICERQEDRQRELSVELKALAASGFFKSLGIEPVISETTLPSADRGQDASDDRAAMVRPVYLQASSPSDGTFDFCLLAADLGAALQSHRLSLPPQTLDEASRLAARSYSLTPELGEQLARTYVPEPLKELMQRSLSRPAAHLVVIHDRASSAIPWETFFIDGKSPALENGVSRLYRIGGRDRMGGRPALPRSSMLRMLVIENPTGDLIGAANEGAALTALFADKRGTVTVLRGNDATRSNVLSELASGNYDILHYAGHADFDEARPSESGLICQDGRLTAAALQDIGRLPRLIFLNACESGRLRQGAADGERAPKALFGANVTLAESFLISGIANFIGTYWPVNDAAAMRFASVFYTNLLDGRAMSVALREARREIRSLGPRDWANYLHFGDPLYTLRHG
jgi:lysophospholipase L1-like esterase